MPKTEQHTEENEGRAVPGVPVVSGVEQETQELDEDTASAPEGQGRFTDKARDLLTDDRPKHVRRRARRPAKKISGWHPVIQGVAVRLGGLALAALAVVLAAALDWSRLAIGVIAGACGAIVVATPLFQWRTDRHVQRLVADTAGARSLEALADPALSNLPVDRLYREVLARLRLTAGADVAALFLADGDRRWLRVIAAHGRLSVISVGEEIEWGIGAIGAVAESGRIAVVDDVSAEDRAGLVGSMASLMAAPLSVDGQVTGVVAVATAHAHGFEPKHLRLLEIAAGRCAASIEHARLVEAERRNRLGAEHARLHLGMLAGAGLVLSRAMESYEDALASLGDIVVPAFADWFSIDLVDENGQLHRVCERSREDDGGVGSSLDEPRGPTHHRHPEGEVLVRQAVDTGRPRVVMPGRRGTRHGGEPVALEDALESVPEAGVESMMVIPVRIRGLSMGALTFVTESGRRGYRRSDLETAEGLANRVGVAVERALSWRQIQAGEEAATLHAARLQALMEAALVVSAPLAESEILDVLVDHAHRVVDADHVVIGSAGDGKPRLEREWTATASGPTPAEVVRAVVDATRRTARRSVVSDEAAPAEAEASTSVGTPWIAVALTADRGGPPRVLVAFGAPGRRFSAEDESVLGLLAQMASEALQNAHLYDAVQGNQHRLQAILDSSPLAIAEVDLGGQAQWWNRAAAELFGWHPHGTGEGKIPVRDSAASVLTGLWERSRRGDATVGTELGATSTSGEQLELSMSTAPLRDLHGEVSGVLVVAEDITERRRLLDRFHQAERLSAMARMAGGMAHDFNNLLTVILGCSEVLMARVEDEPLLQEVTAIQRAGQRAAALTGQLLTIGQRRATQSGTVVLDDVVCAMEPMLVGLLGEDVELEVDPGATATSIAIDQAELERAVLNLAINARDAMADGGRLTIQTHVAGPKRRTESRLVALTVSDTGVGMDVETREHCFEPFFTTKGLARGTGLGLATVHAMVTQAGGQITVESAPGRGASFTLWFPVAAARSLEAAGAAQENGLSGLLLIVEDEAELRRLSARELERRGYTVVAFAGVDEALSELEARGGNVDLVITDVVMPGRSGLELRRVMSEVFPEIPVLFISGNVSDSAGAESLSIDGADAFLGKPFTPEQLVFRVRQVLMSRGAHRRTDS